MLKKNEPTFIHAVLLVIAVLLCGAPVHAQGFSADLVDSSVPMMPPQHIPVHSQDDKMRMEMTDLETPGSSATALIDFARHSAIIVLPAQHVYIDATTLGFGRKIDWQLFRPQSAEDACATWTKIPAQNKTPIVCKKLGVETVNGRAAYKYQASGFGDMRDGLLWVDQRLHVLLKMDAEGTHLEMQDLREASQAANLFEIPAGYQKVGLAGMVLDSHRR
jgi:hypothetical protein